MNPLAIHQGALDAVSKAVLAGDFDADAVLIDLPYHIQTETAQLLVTTRADPRPTFDALSQGLKACGITYDERIAHEANLVSPDLIKGWHHTHPIADGWRFSDSRYPIKSTTWSLTADDMFAAVPVSLQEIKA